jgi:hypothetical protein
MGCGLGTASRKLSGELWEIESLDDPRAKGKIIRLWVVVVAPERVRISLHHLKSALSKRPEIIQDVVAQIGAGREWVIDMLVF